MQCIRKNLSKDTFEISTYFIEQDQIFIWMWLSISRTYIILIQGGEGVNSISVSQHKPQIWKTEISFFLFDWWKQARKIFSRFSAKRTFHYSNNEYWWEIHIMFFYSEILPVFNNIENVIQKRENSFSIYF